MNSIFPKSLTVKQAIIATLAYFDLFEVPLTRNEISEHLFFTDPDEGKIDIYLRESPLINLKDGLYSLQQYPIFFQNFSEKQARAKEYWKRVKKYQWIFSICPFVKMVGVCNSLPIQDVHEESDIDLFVVTKNKHLFTARFFLTLLTSIFFVRRHGNRVRKRFCLSFYASEDDMCLNNITQKPYDIYLAYWIKTLEPISGEYETYLSFLEQNISWLNNYFKTITPHKRYFRKPSPQQYQWKQRLERIFGSKEWEDRFKNWQLTRAKTKFNELENSSGTIISETMLKFHDYDVRDQVRKDWVKRMDSVL